MRNLLPLLLLVSNVAFAQPKTVMSTHRLFPKTEKVAELEKAIADYARDHQNGQWRWKVYQILSGPDAGGYHIEEGPLSWKDMDESAYNNSTAYQTFIKTVAPLTDHMGAGCARYRQELSNSPLHDSADQLSIDHIFYKPGDVGVLEVMIKKEHKNWIAEKKNVAVFQNATSGPEHFILVTRHKQGWKEKDHHTFSENYSGANQIWSEMLKLRRDLSSN